MIQLAAQTLQSFFSGGGKAREHAEYALAEVDFRAPVLHPPSVRIFDGERLRVRESGRDPRAWGRDRSPGGGASATSCVRRRSIDGEGGIGGFTLMNL